MATSNFFKGGNNTLLQPVEQAAENPSSTGNYNEGDIIWNRTAETFYKISSGSWVVATFSGSTPTLNSISDVNTTGVADGQGIAFDASTSTWKPVTFGTGSSSALNDLSDVTITGPQDNDILYYDNSTSTWRRQPFSTQEAYSSLSDLTTALSGSYAALSHTHSASDVTAGTFANARVAESNVTQHEAALSVTTSQVTDFRASVGTYVDAVAGGAGFTNVSGSVALNLNSGRAFHQTMVGNISSLSFSNIPTVTEYATVWSWALNIDATGGYTISGTPTVTWVDGNSWSNLDLSANGVNLVTFWRVASTTYGSLVYNGTVSLDPYRLSFSQDGSQLIVVDAAETVALGDATNVEADGTAGTGTLSFEKNGVAVSGSTSLADGDVLTVTLSSSTTATAVSIPRSV